MKEKVKKETRLGRPQSADIRESVSYAFCHLLKGMEAEELS